MGNFKLKVNFTHTLDYRMAGKAKRGSKRGRAAAVTGSKRAGIIFPVGRCTGKIRQGRYSNRVGVGGGVFMAAALEYLTMEILDLAGQCADEHKKKTIAPRHIQLAIRNDEELNKLFASIQLSQGGVRPEINEMLWPKKGSK